MSIDPMTDAETAALRQAIALACRREEAASVAALVREMEAAAPDRDLVAGRAKALVAAVRQQRRGAGGVDHLMHEFALSSQEGVALMCLAEALLRIPDKATADRLIRDKISQGNWAAHLGHSDSLFVNAAAWGLMLTGKLVAGGGNDPGPVLSRLLARGGEPLVRRGVEFAMQLLGQQFVMAESIDAALLRARSNESRGYAYSFDMLGEAALTDADARRYTQAYADAIDAIGRAGAGRGGYGGPGISVKLSALHPRYGRAQKQRIMAELLPRLKSLMALARQHDMGLNIDAEEAERLDLSLDLLTALAADPDLAGWQGLGFVVQAYQKRCPFVIDYLRHLARRSGHRFMLRLVKGAYWDSEIKRAQVEGQGDYPVYTRKVHTDLAYLVCAGRLLAAPDAFYPQFATHNAHTLAAVMEMARQRGIADYEFQCLHGMGEPLYDNVVGSARLGQRCRIYAPVGSHKTLLPYLVRRLLENGANSSFVNRLVDEAVSLEELVRDPLDQVRGEGGLSHPKIPLPRHLYGQQRLNAAGLDLADEDTIASLERDLAAFQGSTWVAAPLVAGGRPGRSEAKAVTNPADRSDRVGTVIEATLADVEAALAAAEAFAPTWQAVPAGQRANLLNRAADLLEAHRHELMALGIREAGKTWPNALAEVREAVDFCRYYAQQLLAAPAPAMPAPGPVACISPWNFPLAIFVGEVTAALAAGSPVLAKPAEQTPLAAAFAVALLQRAGLPAAALQLLPGPGETVGAALAADRRLRGVLFTGSTEVARLIQRSLARHGGPAEPLLIAETGGVNAMIVDSSAQPEQVVQDVLVSGFDSAGQRCSALRVLCLQRDIADDLLAMLKEAMAELAVGNPRHQATDVGPVIDQAARQGLEAHVARMAAAGRRIFRVPLPPACSAGSFVAPTLIEIDSLAELEGEVFGPVVHVLRFDGDRLGDIIAAVNGSGYGLTFGLHSRVDASMDLAANQVRAGNIYINRNMVGAVVGVQPFGGEAKSGTGPKAGGPLYLHRLLGTAELPLQRLGFFPRPLPPALLAPLTGLGQWAARQSRPGLARFCAEYLAATPLGQELRLPGPTGESNRLLFAPRGDILCLGAGEDNLLAQIAACLATGNRALLPAGDGPRSLLAQLPAEVRERLAMAPAAGAASIGAALFAGPGDEAGRWRQALAAGDGPLVPVIGPDAGGGRYPLHRLLVERTLTINTTAAGGNASLMALGA